jgi:predicted RNA-binding protein YlxR (DUF448 family)
MLSAADIAEDDGPAPETGADGPVRRCIASGRTGPRDSFLRFVSGPDETVVPDIDGKLPGRGLWLTVSRAALDEAIAKNAFSKAARAKLKAPDGLAETVDRLLLRRALEGLSLAKRAGAVAAGFTKAKALIDKGGAGLVVEALDASRAERARLGGRDIETVTGLSAEDMGAALGRDNAVHVALRAGPLAARVKTDLARLAAFRGDSLGKGDR